MAFHGRTKWCKVTNSAAMAVDRLYDWEDVGHSMATPATLGALADRIWIGIAVCADPTKWACGGLSSAAYLRPTIRKLHQFAQYPTPGSIRQGK